MRIKPSLQVPPEEQKSFVKNHYFNHEYGEKLPKSLNHTDTQKAANPDTISFRQEWAASFPANFQENKAEINGIPPHDLGSSPEDSDQAMSSPEQVRSSEDEAESETSPLLADFQDEQEEVEDDSLTGRNDDCNNNLPQSSPFIDLKDPFLHSCDMSDSKKGSFALRNFNNNNNHRDHGVPSSRDTNNPWYPQTNCDTNPNFTMNPFDECLSREQGNLGSCFKPVNSTESDSLYSHNKNGASLPLVTDYFTVNSSATVTNMVPISASVTSAKEPGNLLQSKLVCPSSAENIDSQVLEDLFHRKVKNTPTIVTKNSTSTDCISTPSSAFRYYKNHNQRGSRKDAVLSTGKTSSGWRTRSNYADNDLTQAAFKVNPFDEVYRHRSRNTASSDRMAKSMTSEALYAQDKSGSFIVVNGRMPLDANVESFCSVKNTSPSQVLDDGKKYSTTPSGISNNSDSGGIFCYASQDFRSRENNRDSYNSEIMSSSNFFNPWSPLTMDSTKTPATFIVNPFDKFFDHAQDEEGILPEPGKSVLPEPLRSVDKDFNSVFTNSSTVKSVEDVEYPLQKTKESTSSTENSSSQRPHLDPIQLTNKIACTGKNEAATTTILNADVTVLNQENTYPSFLRMNTLIDTTSNSHEASIASNTKEKLTTEFSNSSAEDISFTEDKLSTSDWSMNSSSPSPNSHLSRPLYRRVSLGMVSEDNKHSPSTSSIDNPPDEDSSINGCYVTRHNISTIQSSYDDKQELTDFFSSDIDDRSASDASPESDTSGSAADINVNLVSSNFNNFTLSSSKRDDILYLAQSRGKPKVVNICETQQKLLSETKILNTGRNLSRNVIKDYRLRQRKRDFVTRCSVLKRASRNELIADGFVLEKVKSNPDWRRQQSALCTSDEVLKHFGEVPVDEGYDDLVVPSSVPNDIPNTSFGEFEESTNDDSGHPPPKEPDNDVVRCTVNPLSPENQKTANFCSPKDNGYEALFREANPGDKVGPLSVCAIESPIDNVTVISDIDSQVVPEPKTIEQVDNSRVDENSNGRDTSLDDGSELNQISQLSSPKEDALCKKSASRKGKRVSPALDLLGDFDVYNIETTMPTIDWEAMEANLARAAKEDDWLIRRRNDREEIRRRLALDPDTADDCFGGRRPSLGARLQSGMSLQICFVNEAASDPESQPDSPPPNNASPADEEPLLPSLPTLQMGVPSQDTNSGAMSPNNNTKKDTGDNERTEKQTTEKEKSAKRPSFFFARQRSWRLRPRSRRDQEPKGIREEEDFCARHARLQAEARLALAQAKEMARMQMEVERQKSKKSPIADIVGLTFLDNRHQLNRQVLTDMNVAQLQVIVNDLHTQIENLNEDLVRFLLTRDDLHMEQDSMLVDIEDLTRYLGAKDEAHKGQPPVTKTRSKK